MKSPDRTTVAKLTDLPNIGEAMARDLHLIGNNGYQLYDKLCRVTGKRHNPCVIDVFLSVVDFMNGGEAKPWWGFTKERKKYDRTV